MQLEEKSATESEARTGRIANKTKHTHASWQIRTKSIVCQSIRSLTALNALLFMHSEFVRIHSSTLTSLKLFIKCATATVDKHTKRKCFKSHSKSGAIQKKEEITVERMSEREKNELSVYFFPCARTPLLAMCQEGITGKRKKTKTKHKKTTTFPEGH